MEWTEKSAVAEFLLDVGVHILPGETGGGEVGCSMARTRWGQERDVPAECAVPEDFRAVEVGPQVRIPILEVEGLVGKGDLEAIHVCRMTGDGESSADPLDVELLGRGARSLRKRVARAGRRKIRDDLFAVQELVPEPVVGVVRGVRGLVFEESWMRICRGETER